MGMDHLHDEARRRIQLLEWAALYPGLHREKIVALLEMDEMCARLYPRLEQVVRRIRTNAHAKSNRPDTAGLVQEAENRLIDLLCGIVGHAVDAGELWLPEEVSSEQVAVGLWVLAFGRRANTHDAASEDPSRSESIILSTRGSLSLLADCLEWHPLSSEWDYRATRRRVLTYLGQARAAGSEELALLACCEGSSRQPEAA